jgi:NTP pyrophosphatase (non-canonical NTP hydrolase)
MKVYVAGPVTSSGSQAENTRNAINVAQYLHSNGHHPFIPHLFFLWEVSHAKTHEEMMMMCKTWLLECDVVVRLPGHSKGADMEEVWAREASIPVYKHPDERIGDILVPARLFVNDAKNGKVVVAEDWPKSELVKPMPQMSLAAHLAEWQDKVARWIEKQPFHPQQPWQPLLGVGEEVGELNHAFLKRSQGIRGTADQHTEKMKDAVGDIMVYLAGFCIAEGLDMGECVEKAWSEVSQRDWNKNRTTGARGTGRTTRLLTECVEMSMRGQRVVFVGSTKAFIETVALPILRNLLVGKGGSLITGGYLHTRFKAPGGGDLMLYHGPDATTRFRGQDLHIVFDHAYKGPIT